MDGSRCAFRLCVDVHLGKEGGQQRIHEMGYDVVMKMVTPFMNQNHHIVRLLEHLEAQDTFACATVRSNRWCALNKNCIPGKRLSGKRGTLFFTKWHKRNVCVISTNFSPVGDDVEIQHRNQRVLKSEVVAFYKKNMGGVDIADQTRKYYSVGRSSYKWYRYIFWVLTDVSICNAFSNFFPLIYGQPKLKQLPFRRDLSNQLIAGFSSCVSPAQATKRRKVETLSLAPGNAAKHFCVKITGRKMGCVQCKKVGHKTAKGRAIESSFECIQCGVALCKVDCFNRYHS